MKDAYLEKSTHSLRAAEILATSSLPEESVSMAYYAMYHSLTALLFGTGIKCENHAGTIILLKRLFNRQDLYSEVSKAKEERIDKQYYADFKASLKEAEELIEKAQRFTHAIKLIIYSQTADDRRKAKEFLGEL